MNVVTTGHSQAGMPAKNIVYRRTELGEMAWRCLDSGLPRGYRRILDLINARVTVGYLIAKLSDYPVKQVHDWLDELETLFFIDAVTLPEDSDLIRRVA
jgi:hypothetical protein